MSKYTINLLLFLALILCTQCADDNSEQNQFNEDDKVYNFIIKDLFTKEIIPDVEVRLNESYGGSFLLDTQEGVSDEDGMIQFITSYNQDSVEQLIIDNMNDPDLTVWQPVVVLSDYHDLVTLEQNGTTLSFRPIFEQDDLITLYSYYGSKLLLTFKKTIPGTTYSITSTLTTEENESFFSNRGTNLEMDISESTSEIKFPANKNVKLVYIVREVDTSDWSQTVILKDSTNIIGNFMEDIRLDISI